MAADPPVVIVTGASGGIGRVTVASLLERGMRAVAAARSIAPAHLPPGAARDLALPVPTDVTDEGSVRDLLVRVGERFGRVDGLVNCAGYVDPAGLLETRLANWRRTLDTNLTGSFLVCRETVRLMKRTGGRIVNIASTAGSSSRPGWAAYAASKAGVINLTLTLADELRPDGIKCFCVCPGRTATDLRRKLAPDEDPTTIMQPAAVAKIILACVCGELDTLEGQAIAVQERW